MSRTRPKTVGCLLAAAVLLGVPGQSYAQRGPARAEVRGVLKAVDAAAQTITVATAEGRQAAAGDKTYPLARDVEVAYGTNASRRAVFRAGKLGELTAGATVVLTLSADQKMVESILAEGPVLRGLLKSVDASKPAVTLVMPQGRGEPAAEEKTGSAPSLLIES